MNNNKNTSHEERLGLKKQELRTDKENYETKDKEQIKKELKEIDLKRTKNVSKNIHVKPADEQQFENNN